jgi:hypothetical protein
MKRGVTAFFKYARLRHEAYHKKQAGFAKGHQSSDPILNQYSFTNVFRELDKTTRWFADNVREPLRDKPEVLLATVLFRLLNRIEVGQAMFLNDSLLAESSAFYELVRACASTTNRKKRVHTAIKNIENAVVAFVGERGPHATGAYIISSPKGYRKLPGILSVVENFALGDWEHWIDNDPAGSECTLEAAWEWLKEHDYFGPFHSYEMVTDLRHTALLDRAPDIMLWANPGPGARRGLNRVHGRDVRDKSAGRVQMISEMKQLLQYSFEPSLWPDCRIDEKKLWLYDHEWPTWEMRDVEHTLCEFDKFERTRLGEGRPRGVYR